MKELEDVCPEPLQALEYRRDEKPTYQKKIYKQEVGGPYCEAFGSRRIGKGARGWAK